MSLNASASVSKLKSHLIFTSHTKVCEVANKKQKFALIKERKCSTNKTGAEARNFGNLSNTSFERAVTRNRFDDLLDMVHILK